MADIIYDTLMKNDNEWNEQLNLNLVEDPEVDARKGLITFNYLGKKVTITVEVE